MSNSKTKVDDLGDGKLKTFPENLKILTDIVSKNIVKDKEWNILNRKVKNLKKGIPVATNSIHINQYNTENCSLEKKNWWCW